MNDVTNDGNNQEYNDIQSRTDTRSDDQILEIGLAGFQYNEQYMMLSMREKIENDYVMDTRYRYIY